MISQFWKLWSPRSRFQKIWCLVRALVHRWPSSQWVITWQKCWESSLESLLCACVLSHFSPVWLLVTPWTLAYQTPLCMEFPCQEYRSGLPCPPPGNLPYPGIEPASCISPALQADSSLAEPLGKPISSYPCLQGSDFNTWILEVTNIQSIILPMTKSPTSVILIKWTWSIMYSYAKHSAHI